MITFRNDSDVLSNYHLCKINYEGKQLSSVEHAYQLKKCHTLIKDAAADESIRSPTGRSAQLIANNVIKDVADLPVWRMCRVEIIKSFQDALLDSRNSILVEATHDDF